MKLGEIKEKAKQKLNDAKMSMDIRLWQAREWAKQNPEQAATIICTAIGAGVVIGKRAVANAKIRKVQSLKDRYIYDRSLGSYWKLKRVPTQSEKVLIANMRKQGKNYADILTSMKLL